MLHPLFCCGKLNLLKMQRCPVCCGGAFYFRISFGELLPTGNEDTRIQRAGEIKR